MEIPIYIRKNINYKKCKKLEEIIFEWYSLISWNFFIKVQTNMEGCAWEKRK